MRLILIFIALGCSIFVLGQKLEKTAKKDLKEAYKALETQDYEEAIDYAQAVLQSYPKNEHAKFIIGRSKLELKGSEREALAYFVEIFDTRPLDNFYYYIGRAYLPHGQFTDAVNALQTILRDKRKSIPEDDILNQLNIAYKSEEIYNAERQVEVNNLGEVVNTSSDEYAPLVMPDKSLMFFASNRGGNYDIYYSGVADEAWGEVISCEGINSKMTELVSSLSHDGTVMLMGKERSEGGNMDLFEVSITDSKQGETKALPYGINSKQSEIDATYSADGNMIFFSSNRDGGYGGFDIYYAKRLPNGEWGREVNLGPTVNTKGDEKSPFFHIDNKTLYYASDGLIGMGGFDIYITELEDNMAWSQAENIGYPINSLGNDSYYSLRDNSQQAFFASDRSGGLGKSDLYVVNIYDHESFKTVIKGNITSTDEGQALEAKITIINEVDKNLNGIYRTNSRGNFIILARPLEEYQMIVEAEGYKTKTIKKSFAELEEMGQIKVTMEKIPE